jgi:hypothetical protein
MQPMQMNREEQGEAPKETKKGFHLFPSNDRVLRSYPANGDDNLIKKTSVNDFSFFRPPSSSAERLIIPLAGKIKAGINEKYKDLPVALHDHNINQSEWSNWVDGMTAADETSNPSSKFLKICCFMTVVGCPVYLYLQCKDLKAGEQARRNGVDILNNDVLRNVLYAKVQESYAHAGGGRSAASNDSPRRTISWISISLTEEDAVKLKQENDFQCVTDSRRDGPVHEEYPEGAIADCICCGLYHY